MNARLRLVASIAALAGVAALVSVAGAATPSQVFWKNYRQPVQIEPTRIDINYSTGFAWATGLTEWDSWGTTKATATGTLHLNTCRPYCAAGNYKAFQGRVTLSKVRPCGSQRRYLNIEIKLPNKPTTGWGSNCRGAQLNLL